MDTTTMLLEAGMALAVIGLFLASWFRFRHPVRLTDRKPRVSPALSDAQSAETPSGTDSKRAPSL